MRVQMYAMQMFKFQALLAMLLLISLEVPKVEAYGDLPISNMPLYSDGIYFENLKPVKIQLSTWTLQTEYELSEFIGEIALVNASVDKLIQACKQMQASFPDSCKSIGNILELTRELNDFKILLDSLCEDKTRRRRGILKSWFGLMDDDDREEIDGNFNKIDKQIESQSSTIEHFFNSTNKAIAVLSGNVFQVDPKKPGTIDYSKEGQLLMMDILLNKIIRKKDLFMKLLQSSSSVSLSDDIVSPNRLLKELEKLKKILPEEFTFPVAMTLRDVIKMYPLSKVVAYVDNCKMKVSILLPLCNDLEYTTLKGTSVPTMQDGVLKMFPLENDVLVYNDKHHLGMVFNYEEYKRCNHLTNFALCNNHHLMKNLSSAVDCIVASFFNRTSNSDCRVSRLELRHQLWIQLADPNGWVYAVPNRTIIEVTFGLGNKKSVELGGVGMLKLVRMCHVRSQDIILQYVPVLGGTFKPNNLGFQLPAVVTRDQPLIISASDNNKVILVGKNTESALTENTHVSGVHYAQPTISPWAIVGIVCGAFIVSVIAMKMYTFIDKRCQGSMMRLRRRPSAPIF
ncbi:uncharacterized protein LOC129771166 [Toxorhynchites rutilus septentrionalis]|uniref:uncharacterized protein LOC129771166 n=1 Tax=Toxorhynchites rutilus septentrionalis TaxID=329112 RepID=UPI002479605B|nr:uncharacterized protein LOC129771166 [Toxorhynchites rutilus septentrionalis]XP_055630554.1 uncharacterized protein LOC129771166 [Toxorhynchites rutilus septentrionalis]